MYRIFWYHRKKDGREESTLEFDPAESVVIANGGFVRDDGIPVIFVTLAAPYRGGEVQLEGGGFSEFGWFSKEALPPEAECAGNVRSEAIKAIDTLAAVQQHILPQ
ncbi:MAG TPA: hypothetical protein VF261_01875 [Candidatus Saccharimonadales bacterium]